MAIPPPITKQPGGSRWSQAPPVMPVNCPPGLEYLASVGQIYVKQCIELFEIATGVETENRYELVDNFGNRIYMAMEESNCCLRRCMGSTRPFDMHIYDAYQREVMRVVRPCQCCAWCPCCHCCAPRVEIQAPVGVTIGEVVQECVCCYYAFAIKAASGQKVLSIRRAWCNCQCGDKVFQVTDNMGARVGDVRKMWSGVVQEALTDADNFGITFPIDLEIRTKAMLVGACFLLDFMYYESSGKPDAKKVHA